MSGQYQPVRPVFTAQLGLVQIGVWKKVMQNDEGKRKAYYDTSLKRSYQKDDGSWATTTTVGDRDLGHGIALMQAAQQFIIADSNEAEENNAKVA